jgi:hypothetical protein
MFQLCSVLHDEFECLRNCGTLRSRKPGSHSWMVGRKTLLVLNLLQSPFCPPYTYYRSSVIIIGLQYFTLHVNASTRQRIRHLIRASLASLFLLPQQPRPTKNGSLCTIELYPSIRRIWLLLVLAIDDKVAVKSMKARLPGGFSELGRPYSSTSAVLRSTVRCCNTHGWAAGTRALFFSIT